MDDYCLVASNNLPRAASLASRMQGYIELHRRSQDELARLTEVGFVVMRFQTVALQQMNERDLLFLKRKLLPDAVARSGREGDVRVGVATDRCVFAEALRVELVRVSPHVRVVVEGMDEYSHFGAGWHNVPVQHAVLRGDTSYQWHRRVKTQRLLDHLQTMKE